jgi:imidazolonepropionase-like amidohydrolase
MHVHAAWPGLDSMFAPLFVANGVTGVREMYGSPFVIAAWKHNYQTGAPWPRMIGSGHILDGPKPFWPGSTVAANAEEAKAAVDKLHAGGADFIKVYTKLPRDAYFAALDEAKRIGTYCAGHVPDAVTVSEASDHGQRSVEHLTGVALECSKDADVLRAERAAAAADTSANLMKVWLGQSKRILATQDPKRAADLYARLARNHTWQVPTLTVLRSMSSMNDSVFTNDPRTKYMPEQIVDGWDWKHDFRFRSRTPEDWENGKQMFKLSMQIVGAMNKAGVPMMAGTDMLNPFTFPGFSLHDELVNLTEAGLSPAEALRAATLNPAIFMNATDSLGTVEKGKRADLVLLGANPLDDIHNTQKVNAVVLNGRLYDRAALDSLVAGSQRLARPKH